MLTRHICLVEDRAEQPVNKFVQKEDCHKANHESAIDLGVWLSEPLAIGAEKVLQEIFVGFQASRLAENIIIREDGCVGEDEEGQDNVDKDRVLHNFPCDLRHVDAVAGWCLEDS